MNDEFGRDGYTDERTRIFMPDGGEDAGNGQDTFSPFSADAEGEPKAAHAETEGAKKPVDEEAILLSARDYASQRERNSGAAEGSPQGRNLSAGVSGQAPLFCTQCGTKNKEGALFCYRCGAPMKTAAAGYSQPSSGYSQPVSVPRGRGTQPTGSRQRQNNSGFVRYGRQGISDYGRNNLPQPTTYRDLYAGNNAGHRGPVYPAGSDGNSFYGQRHTGAAGSVAQLRQTASTTIFLVAILSFTATIILHFISEMSGTSLMKTLFEAMGEEMEVFGSSLRTYSFWSVVFPEIPHILAASGLWILFLELKKAFNSRPSVFGCTLIQIGLWIALVYNCICFLGYGVLLSYLNSFVKDLGNVSSFYGFYDYDNAGLSFLSRLFGLIVVVFVVAAVLVILFYIRSLNMVGTTKQLMLGVPFRKAKAYNLVGVLLIVSAVCRVMECIFYSYLNAFFRDTVGISLSLNGATVMYRLCQALSAIAFACVIFRLHQPAVSRRYG